MLNYIIINLYNRNYSLGSDTSADDQQVGSLWQGEHLVSLSLSGNLNYWSLSEQTPTRVVEVGILI